MMPWYCIVYAVISVIYFLCFIMPYGDPVSGSQDRGFEVLGKIVAAIFMAVFWPVTALSNGIIAMINFAMP